MKCIILAAGVGKRLRPYTLDTPKPLLKVGDKSLLQYKIESLRRHGFQDKDLVVVVGYHQKQIIREFKGLAFIFNEHYFTRNNMYSLWLARQHTTGGFFLFNADTLHSREIFGRVFASTHHSLIAVDPTLKKSHDLSVVVNEKQGVVQVDFNLPSERIQGKAAQFSKFGSLDAPVFMRYVQQCVNQEQFMNGANVVPRELCSALHISALDIGGLLWAEVDTLSDLNSARRMIQKNGNLF